jgi:serine/threonine-protein kinase HipA
VYWDDRFAGILRQEPGGRCRFTYDQAYVAAGGPAIAHTLPIRPEPYLYERQLSPFFDNLVAEGWLGEAQARALGVSPANRFALLLGFGHDCAGAVSVVDPDPLSPLSLDAMEPASIAALASRASLSGIQPKMLAVETATGFRPAQSTETATHIAKLPGSLPHLIALEWLSTEATRKLLPTEAVAEMHIAGIEGLADEALLIRRFDRIVEDKRVRRLHFEEFTQLLDKPPDFKYQAGYEDMAAFIRNTPGCIPAEAERLYRRILACLLIGNTDAHLKNFAMFHTPDGLRLTPCYDLVASAWYRQFDTVALKISGARDLRLGQLQPKHLIAIGTGFGLSTAAIQLAVEDLGKRLGAAQAAIENSPAGNDLLRKDLIKMMEKRWNGTFASTGRYLSKKRSGAARPSS